MMGISFIVPVYNGEETLRMCLDAILAQSTELPIEVIVVDNGSTDETSTILRAFKEVRVLDLPIRGRSRARNTGAMAAKYPILAFIDCDVLIAADWLSTLLPQLKTPFGAVQTTITTKSANVEKEIHHLNPKSTFQTLDSCSLLITKEAFLEAGGFEESLLRWEDSHLTMKLLSLGYGVLVKAPSRALKLEKRNLFQRLKRLYESGQAEGAVMKAWFPDHRLSFRSLLNLKYHDSMVAGSLKLLGQVRSKSLAIPPLKSKKGWTVINESLALSKHVNLIVGPEFICLKTLSNKILHAIDRSHPGFDRLLERVYTGEDIWEEVFTLFPDDPLILKRKSA